MTVKLLIEHHLEFLSIKGGCTGWSESTLVKIPHCWKSHVTAHISVFCQIFCIFNQKCLTLESTILFLPKMLIRPGPEVKIFMLNSTEHEISTVQKKTKIPTNEEISCVKSLSCCIYHADKC